MSRRSGTSGRRSSAMAPPALADPAAPQVTCVCALDTVSCPFCQAMIVVNMLDLKFVPHYFHGAVVMCGLNGHAAWPRTFV